MGGLLRGVDDLEAERDALVDRRWSDLIQSRNTHVCLPTGACTLRPTFPLCTFVDARKSCRRVVYKQDVPPQVTAAYAPSLIVIL